MGRKEICGKLRKHAEVALSSHNAPGKCRETVKALRLLAQDDPEVAPHVGRVLTVYYRTGDDEASVWDHTVFTAKFVPDLVVVEPRLHFLTEETGGHRGAWQSVFIGSLRAWQLRVERSTGGVIIEYVWSDTTPDDGFVLDTMMLLHSPNKNQPDPKDRMMRVVVK